MLWTSFQPFVLFVCLSALYFLLNVCVQKLHLNWLLFKDFSGRGMVFRSTSCSSAFLFLSCLLCTSCIWLLTHSSFTNLICHVMQSHLSQKNWLQLTSDERNFSVARSSPSLMLSSVGECSILICSVSFVFSLKAYVQIWHFQDPVCDKFICYLKLPLNEKEDSHLLHFDRSSWYGTCCTSASSESDVLPLSIGSYSSSDSCDSSNERDISVARSSPSLMFSSVGECSSLIFG